MRDKIVDFHADDYGYTLNTSKGILDCMKQGALDSISLITNTSYFDKSVELLYEEIPNLPFLPEIAVHLNLVEGFASNKNFNVIVENGILDLSWGSILLKSLTPSRKKLKEELKIEIKEQIEKTNVVIEECLKIAHKNHIPYDQKGIRIDSHTHTHSIPIVWEALIEVIDENKYNVEFIRNPKEPIWIFIKNIGLYKTYQPINFIKNFILNIFSHKIDRYADSHHLQKMYMWGLIMSGHMDYDRVDKLYKDIYNKSKDEHRYLEILAHPGKALSKEVRKEFSKENMKNFNLTENRDLEKEMFIRFNEVNHK